MVKGDLIIPVSDRIRTRSQSKNSTLRSPHIFHKLTRPDPDQFTIIPAPLKIIKVLIEELLSASGMQSAAAQAAAAAAEFADEEGDDDGWEDLPNTLDLGLGSTKAELMAWGEGQGSFVRQRDDETQAYLTEFFIKASRENVAGFNELYGALTEEEKMKLNELASQ
jgi:importin-9